MARKATPKTTNDPEWVEDVGGGGIAPKTVLILPHHPTTTNGYLVTHYAVQIESLASDGSLLHDDEQVVAFAPSDIRCTVNVDQDADSYLITVTPRCDCREGAVAVPSQMRVAADKVTPGENLPMQWTETIALPQPAAVRME